MGTLSRTQSVVNAYGALLGDGSPKGHGPTGWGAGECCPIGGRCLWSAFGGIAAPNSAGPLARGTRSLPLWCSLPKEHPWGNGGPKRRGPSGQGIWESYPLVVAAYGALAGVGNPQRHRPINRGDGESFPVGVRCLWSTLGMTAPNVVGPLAGGTGSPTHSVVAAFGAPLGDGGPKQRGQTGWGDRDWIDLEGDRAILAYLW